MKQTVVLASQNSGKLKELQILLAPLNWQIVSQKEKNVSSIAETGFTFIENALIKARHVASMTQLPTIADDSGLVVDALNGKPGIYSARFANNNATDNDNINALLDAMADKKNRKAYFHCTIVYLPHAQCPTPIIAQGKLNGELLTEKKGTNGFGYDPIFYIPEAHCTAAQLPMTKKNQISHRGLALKALVSSLKERE